MRARHLDGPLEVSLECAKPLASGRKLERQLLHLVGKAAGHYAMIGEGDKIAVALSGGKDSFTLLKILNLLRRHSPVRFELAGLTVHNGSEYFQSDVIARFAGELGVPFYLEKTSITTIVEKKLRPGSHHCSLCARLRRGAIYAAAIREGFNKVALGHHLDDAIETFLMNFFFVGALKSMPPKLKAENGSVTLIRPLYFTQEKMIADYAAEQHLPVIDCGCWLCGEHDDERARMKKLVTEISSRYKSSRQSMRNALTNLQPRFLADTGHHDFSLEDVPCQPRSYNR